jgi:nitrogen fixation/metabolism regulation signal transduction histidine kinase
MDRLTKVSLVTLTVVGVGIYGFFGKESQSVTNSSSVVENSYISHTEAKISDKSVSVLSSNKDIQTAKEEALSPKEKLYKQQYQGMMSTKAKSLRQREYYKKLHEQRVTQQNVMIQRHKEQQRAIAMNMINQQRVKNSTFQMNQMKYRRMNEQNIQKSILQNKQLNEKS